MAIPKNVGFWDRAIRIVLGIALLLAVSLAFTGPKSPLAWLGLVGIVPLVTGIRGYCGLYTLLGVNTCKLEHKPPDISP